MSIMCSEDIAMSKFLTNEILLVPRSVVLKTFTGFYFWLRNELLAIPPSYLSLPRKERRVSRGFRGAKLAEPETNTKRK